MCFFAGGTRFSEQGFGLGAAQVNSSLLIIAVIAVLLPGAFDLSLNLIRSENTNSQNLDPDYQLDILHLSHGLAIILLVSACVRLYDLTCADGVQSTAAISRSSWSRTRTFTRIRTTPTWPRVRPTIGRAKSTGTM
jgi:calcium/proton exchanger cax